MMNQQNQMTAKNAFEIVTASIDKAVKSGAYNLADVNQILNALGYLMKIIEANKPIEPTEQAKESF